MVILILSIIVMTMIIDHHDHHDLHDHYDHRTYIELRGKEVGAAGSLEDVNHLKFSQHIRTIPDQFPKNTLSSA